MTPPHHPTRRALLGLACLGGAAQAAGLPAPQRLAWPARQPVPPLELPQLDGPAWRLAEQRGRVVVVNFWASWCEPCRSELPSLELLAARHEAQGLVVVTVNFRETEGTIRRFLAQQPLSLPVLRDIDGSTARAWGVKLYPTTVVIDRGGRPAFTVPGEADWSADPVRGWVTALLPESPIPTRRNPR